MSYSNIKSTILIVEDDPDLLGAIVNTLDLEGYRCLKSSNGIEAMQHVRSESIDMVLTDVNMPEMDGVTLLRKIKEIKPMLPVLMMTAFGSVQKAVMAIKRGAIDYIAKPFNCEELINKIDQYLDKGGLKYQKSDENPSVVSPVVEDNTSVQLLNLAKKVAKSNSSILITGESGTGKEVLARFIHQQSDRAEEKFVAINCAAIPDNMLEAILFGHEKGAFTGAHQATPGKFEQANGGTILLDEISEMDLALQAKLLRVLQEREVERIGGKKTIALDVRILATTNRQLLDYVKEGKFREDLYYRLNVFPLRWMPLRKRKNDIKPLANFLLQKHAQVQKEGERYFEPSAMNKLIEHHWPGNVRELENVVQRCLILTSGSAITESDIFLEDPEWISSQPTVGVREVGQLGDLDSLDKREGIVSREGVPNTDQDTHNSREPIYPVHSNSELSTTEQSDQSPASLGENLQMREFQVIINTLKEVKGRRKSAAEKLGISPRTLRYKLARMRDSGIDLESVI